MYIHPNHLTNSPLPEGAPPPPLVKTTQFCTYNYCHDCWFQFRNFIDLNAVGLPRLVQENNCRKQSVVVGNLLFLFIRTIQNSVQCLNNLWSMTVVQKRPPSASRSQNKARLQTQKTWRTWPFFMRSLHSSTKELRRVKESVKVMYRIIPRSK